MIPFWSSAGGGLQVSNIVVASIAYPEEFAGGAVGATDWNVKEKDQEMCDGLVHLHEIIQVILKCERKKSW